MKTKIILVASCLVATVTAVSSAASPAGPPRVTQVVVLDVGANMQKFNDLNSRMDTIAAKYQSTGKARFWITTLAGTEVGRVIITIEYPSLISFAPAGPGVVKNVTSPLFGGPGLGPNIITRNLTPDYTGYPGAWP